MRTLAVVGGEGFVGSAFVRQAAKSGYSVTSITRANYDAVKGSRFDVVVDAAGNSRKYLSEENPALDFELSVRHRLNTLLDLQAGLHLHVSSVDVYSNLGSTETTREDAFIDRSRQSRYGFHKLLAEDLVRHYAAAWLIVRLAGMVGPGLRKNPVHDILHGISLRISEDSQYQFMRTDAAASHALSLVQRRMTASVVNICGRGLISPREIARMAGRALPPRESSTEARIVDVSIARLQELCEVEETQSAIAGYLAGE